MKRALASALLAACIAAPCFAAGGPASRFELEGKVVSDEGRPFRGTSAVVFLNGSTTPFSAWTTVDRGGRFRFTKLAAGLYTLMVVVPKAGLRQKTIDVGASFADARGRISELLTVERRPKVDSHTVPLAQLQVPPRAVEETVRAQECLARSDAGGAVRHLDLAVEIAPHFSEAWNTLGTIAYKTRQYPRAEEAFRRALAADPEAFAPLVNLGGALLSQGKIEESLEVNLRAVKTHPDDALAHAQLGQSYFFLDRLPDAEIHLKAAKELDPPHFSFPQLILADLYERKGDHQAATEELREFLRYHPDSPLAADVARSLERVQGGPSEHPEPRR